MRFNYSHYLLTFCTHIIYSRHLLKLYPTVVIYRRIAGDGDCGSTFKNVLQILLPKISSLDYSSLRSLFEQLADLVETDMGGTSGKPFCIDSDYSYRIL